MFRLSAVPTALITAVHDLHWQALCTFWTLTLVCWQGGTVSFCLLCTEMASGLQAQHSKSSKYTHSYIIGTMTGHKTSSGRGTLADVHEKTLVVYLYSRTDPVYQNNIKYFISHGMSANDGCDYIVVLQGADSAKVLPLIRRFFLVRTDAAVPSNERLSLDKSIQSVAILYKKISWPQRLSHVFSIPFGGRFD